tara:strand:+ start:1602 stop:2459 length:858 start_codon:yes stop_codon:yes gene_type:complete
MEPQMIDYYNELPQVVNVIDKMNEELAELQVKYEELITLYVEYVRTHLDETFIMPKIRVNTMDELKVYGERIFNSVPVFTKIIYDFLKYEGWILECDRPDREGLGVMGYSGCGFWDNWEHTELKWGDTSAQEFYYGELCTTNYNVYLKCKLLEELYNLFPEYTERKRGWFHKIIDEAFETIGITIGTILEYECMLSKGELHDMIYRIIIEKLFGWGRGHEAEGVGAFPLYYLNEDYIQNIIYYQCETCKKIFHGEDAMEYQEEEYEISWFQENGNICQEPCSCHR